VDHLWDRSAPRTNNPDWLLDTAPNVKLRGKYCNISKIYLECIVQTMCPSGSNKVEIGTCFLNESITVDIELPRTKSAISIAPNKLENSNLLNKPILLPPGFSGIIIEFITVNAWM